MQISTWRSGLLDFLQNEQGSAYTLSYVMVLPFVAVLVMLTAETAMILLTKLGTSYAAYAAARTAIVWEPSASEEVTIQKATQAAAQAITPFANGLSSDTKTNLGTAPLEEDYVKVLQASSGTKASMGYVRKKYRYSQNATSVSVVKVQNGGEAEPWEYDLQCTVEYRYAFHVPFIARFYGSPDGRMVITSKSSLPSESPKNTEQALGISYASQK